MRTSVAGGARGSWSQPRVIANVSEATILARDGLYTGTGTFDNETGEVQVYWGECLEKCHPGQGGQAYMSAPTFMLTVSKDAFHSWQHINITALSKK